MKVMKSLVLRKNQRGNYKSSINKLPVAIENNYNSEEILMIFITVWKKY